MKPIVSLLTKLKVKDYIQLVNIIYHMLPKIVCFRITSGCNYDCACCNGPKEVKGLSLDEIKRLVERLYSLGFEKVDIIGGEPLIREDIEEIIGEFKKFGFSVRLDTNGFNFFKYSDFICSHIDILRMPIDDLQGGFRGVEHLENLKKILESLRTKQIKELRIGTVVTRENIKALNDIKDFLENYPINSWELYEFLPQNNAIKSERRLCIPGLEFEKATKRLRSNEFNILISKRKLRNRAYFYINPDGSVIIPIEEKHIFLDKRIGDIHDGDIVEKWNKEVSEVNYLDTVEKMF